LNYISLLGPTAVRSRVTDLVKYATDASPYRLFPQVVIVAEFPEIEHVANACIECGYCEPVCPSRHLTTTPRQRIALRREMMRHAPGSAIQKALLKEYEYDAVQTCAGDSSCEHACPVQINTGVMMKQFRHLEHSQGQEWVAERIAK
jgi:D-lactate dehydrogenase